MSKKKMYLVAYYYMKPKHQRVRTSVPGWNKDENNITWDEQIALTTKLKDRDYTTAKIILDLNDRVVKLNGWTSSRDFEELFDHFYKNYKKDLHPVVEQLGYFRATEQDESKLTVADLPIQTVDTTQYAKI